MLFEAFRRMREERPHDAAFLVASGDRSLPISWRQFTDDIAVIVSIIHTYVPGARIGLLGENSYAWMVAHAATMFAGATVVPIDVNLTAEEASRRLKFVGAAALIHSALYADLARDVERLTPGLIVGGFGSRKTDIFMELARRRLRFGVDSVWDHGATYADTSMIVFTSGTTSEPRGAELTVAGVEAFCEWTAKCLPMREGDRSLMLLPLHHIFGVCTTYLMLAKGVALGVCPDFRRIFDAFERFRVNFAFLVPALAEILAQKISLKAQSAEDALGQPIEWILVGGAPLPRRAYEHLASLGIRAVTGYGLTETCAAYSMTPIDGDPHVGAQGQVSHAAGVETKVSGEGELLVRGPCVMRGYHRMPERTAAVIDADGWFHTGDLGRIDEDGFVWITGRASRTIILSSGKKVAPEELEELLLAIPGIREAVVYGNGETRELTAEVYGVISAGMVESAVARLNAQLPVYKRISRTVVRAEPFPRTSSGKIRVENNRV
ncbi:MAG: AMP-binding protein [Kiritimatiellae bacterium]|nr:AMP-binding protein [Kiritimatiellia bacterium]